MPIEPTGTGKAIARLRGEQLVVGGGSRAQVLAAMGALTGESDHDASLSLYAADPDGIEFEVLWPVPSEHWSSQDAVVRPLDWMAAKQRWSARG